MTTCCSTKCEKRHECKKHCFNNIGCYPSEDFYSFGSGSVSTEGCKDTYWCGKLGGYKMFESIKENNTLKDYIEYKGKMYQVSTVEISGLFETMIFPVDRVMNTSNLSESWVGWDTRYGDSVGDCSPLGCLTKTEIRMIAKVLGLPYELVSKTPIDGLCGKTDEESFGFSYEVLDKYIRTGEIEDMDIKAKIDTMHDKNLFKLQLMPSFEL